MAQNAHDVDALNNKTQVLQAELDKRTAELTALKNQAQNTRKARARWKNSSPNWSARKQRLPRKTRMTSMR
ncbi:hypothetical protein CRSA0334_18095 [Cronobacter malonaticus ENBT0334]|nr:hypothetical protein [Cronobacter malonaticus]KIU59802.1 hypothetical protein CRSA0334_18095 [Cronobacter malonaticus ENBT0334]